MSTPTENEIREAWNELHKDYPSRQRTERDWDEVKSYGEELYFRKGAFLLHASAMKKREEEVEKWKEQAQRIEALRRQALETIKYLRRDETVEEKAATMESWERANKMCEEALDERDALKKELAAAKESVRVADALIQARSELDQFRAEPDRWAFCYKGHDLNLKYEKALAAYKAAKKENP